MENSDWKQQINTFLELCEQRENFMRVTLIDKLRGEVTKLVGVHIRDVDYRAEIKRRSILILREEVEALKSKVHILEGKALDAEQDLALNKLGQMRASTKQDAIDRALNEGYNDGFKDGFKESEKYRSDVPEKLRKGRSDAEIILSESEPLGERHE